MSIIDQARQEIVKLLKKQGIAILPDALMYPPNHEMGDLSLPLFIIAASQKRAPGIIAQEFADKIKSAGLIDRAQATGPYLNFFLNKAKTAQMVLSNVVAPKARRSASRLRRGKNSRQRVMVEYVSPNNNKPLHLGHLRNVFLGESICRLLESQGNKVIRACLMNDRGLQIAKVMYAYDLWHKGETPKQAGKKPDRFVADLYVEFERRVKKPEGDGKKPEEIIAAEEIIRKFEAGDKKTIALWKKLGDWAEAGIGATLKRLEIIFDTTFYESQLWKDGKVVVEEGLKRGVFKKDETGAVIVEFNHRGNASVGLDGGVASVLPPKVVLRSDNTAIYATTDLYLGELKFKKYKLDQALWVVGCEQDLYLAQLFAMYKKLGATWADKCKHVSYGFVNLPEGRMKSREGKVVDADDLLDELHGAAMEEITKREKVGNKKFDQKRAEIIAQSALRFFLLSSLPKSTIVYNPKESLAFTGRTGPYLLYMYARINSILKKAKNLKRQITNSKQSTKSKPSDVEWSLVMQLAKFDETVATAARDYDPSHVANYIFSLAQNFSDFYETSPVLQAESSIRTFRLALIKKTKQILEQGFYFLTISPVEKM